MDRAARMLLTDASLSSDARVLGLYIASKGPGAHEVAREELGDVLSNDTTKARVQKAISQLERKHWVHRAPGGRGHADRFEFRGREMRQLNESDPEDRGRQIVPLKDSGRENAHLNGGSADSGREIRPLSADVPFRGRQIVPLKASGGDFRGGNEVSTTSKQATGDEASGDAVGEEPSKQPAGADPVNEIWQVWKEELGGSGPQPKLSTGKRRVVLRKLWDEQLKGQDDPPAVFRKVCRAVQESEHHMSVRAYHLPESLFRNAERRERWVLEALNPSANAIRAGPKKDPEQEYIDKLEADLV